MQRRVRRAAAGVAATLVLAGCASDPEPSPPAGVDLLTIPTPSPDPDDFVARVDNPWLALGPGEQVSLSGPTGTLELAVAADTTTVAGVPVTTMTLTPPGPPAGATTYLLAQDRDGNVWRLLEEGEAGLFMAATPRYGDGYRTAYDEGVVEERAEVTALDGDTLEITTLDPARPGNRTVATYENGTGLVRIETGAGFFAR